MIIKDSNVPMTRYFSNLLHLGSGLEPLAVYVYIHTMVKKSLYQLGHSLNCSALVFKNMLNKKEALVPPFKSTMGSFANKLF